MLHVVAGVNISAGARVRVARSSAHHAPVELIVVSAVCILFAQRNESFRFFFPY